jgi:hypothetical protein
VTWQLTMFHVVRIVLVTVVAFVLQSVASAQVPAGSTVTFHGLTFPASIAGAERFSVHDYEKDSPGLGYSVGYRSPGATTTVYIYDLRKRGIPDDPSAPVIGAELEAAKADIVAARQRWGYLKVELKDEFAISDVRDRPRFRCAGYRMTRADGELASYVCVGGWNSYFVKFRMTGEPQSQPDPRPFMQAWTNLLWPS